MQKSKFPLLIFATFWLLIGHHIPQVYSGTFKITYNPDIFDDQYIGCSGKMEDIMPKVLQKEKANKQFKDAWINATERWEDIKDFLTLPEGFEDEHGIALLTFTNKYPEGNPIYQQLNGNLTIAGASRKDYMEKFHFKALHFYLTRALQILKPNCDKSYTVYRGSPHSHDIKPLLKFGRFTSTSMDREAAQVFGTESLFKITTCFGAKIEDLSFFPLEEEVLIPPTEKFLFVTKENSWFVLKSTGEMCSYFNCAYLKGEKREDAVCRSDTNESEEELKEGRKTKAIPPTEMAERIDVLEDQISRNLHHRDYFQESINEIITYISNNEEEYTLLHSGLDTQIKDLRSSLVTLAEAEKKQVLLLSHHQKLLTSLEEELGKQQNLTRSLMDRESTTLFSIVQNQQILSSLQEECGNLRDQMRSLLRREISISNTIKMHRYLLTSLKEENSKLQGFMVMFSIIFVILGLVIIRKCYH
ncbi:T-cell ecto-ADP-ribosyltransferase 1-like [Dendrobates tinctorius]|uniref:T-cell ecto-ADP-ribosyltransferase 1-like n=1 Tax=Dendrobates tinctorius TaxID=92724 RepID=UPI003CC9C852